MSTAKQELLDLLERLPDDASIESVLDQMLFLAGVLRGAEQADRGEGVSQAEAEKRFSKWLESPGQSKRSGT